MQPLPVTPVRLWTSPPEASPTLSVDLRESQGWALGGGTPGSQKPFPTGPSAGGGGVGGAGEASRTSFFVCKLVGLEATDLASALDHHLLDAPLLESRLPSPRISAARCWRELAGAYP